MIIIFNGPPGSGKDAACEILHDQEFKHLSFKTELFKNVLDYWSLNREETIDFFVGYFNRHLKNTPVDYLHGLSRRQAMIHVSENVMKPRNGKDYYGRKAVELIVEGVDCCFSDGGFVEELQPLIDKYSRDEIAIVQLFRERCTFEGDSRSYITGEIVDGFYEFNMDLHPNKFPGVKTYQIYNDGSLADLKEIISQIIKNMREECTKNQKLVSMT